jgi:FlaA1/EpsC-like NDP-sugar epimerase
MESSYVYVMIEKLPWRLTPRQAKPNAGLSAAPPQRFIEDHGQRLILVTGGAGFIGSNFVLEWLAGGNTPVVNLDKLTYAGNLQNLGAVADDARHIFVRGDIADRALVAGLLQRHRPRAVLHFAAESHVDRSIHGLTSSRRT